MMMSPPPSNQLKIVLLTPFGDSASTSISETVNPEVLESHTHLDLSLSEKSVTINSVLPLSMWGEGSRKALFNLNLPDFTNKSPQPHNHPPRRQVKFYEKHDPYYEFTNFSPHPVKYKNLIYPTGEHLFQAFKFLGHKNDVAEIIRRCSSASQAFKVARERKYDIRSDWYDVNLRKMEETLWQKFTQHQKLRELLLDTGDAEIIEDSPHDAFWGIGKDGRGQNQLGKALERLRSSLISPPTNEIFFDVPEMPGAFISAPNNHQEHQMHRTKTEEAGKSGESSMDVDEN